MAHVSQSHLQQQDELAASREDTRVCFKLREQGRSLAQGLWPMQSKRSDHNRVCPVSAARKLATHLAHEPVIYDLSDNHIFLYPTFIFELLELLLEKLVTHGSVFGESLNQRAIDILGSSNIETILDGHEFAHVFFLCSDRFEGAQETSQDFFYLFRVLVRLFLAGDDAVERIRDHVSGE